MTASEGNAMAIESENAAVQPVHVRSHLVDALRLDLIGPGEVCVSAAETLGDLAEVLAQRPSSWYLTGFLVPLEADPEQKADEQSVDELDQQSEAGGSDDAVTPEPAAACVSFLTSSIGVSVLIPQGARQLRVVARWGDYKVRKSAEGNRGCMFGSATSGKRRSSSTFLSGPCSRTSDLSRAAADSWLPSSCGRC
jgi:hypothetical protein